MGCKACYRKQKAQQGWEGGETLYHKTSSDTGQNPNKAPRRCVPKHLVPHREQVTALMHKQMENTFSLPKMSFTERNCAWNSSFPCGPCLEGWGQWFSPTPRPLARASEIRLPEFTCFPLCFSFSIKLEYSFLCQDVVNNICSPPQVNPPTPFSPRLLAS